MPRVRAQSVSYATLPTTPSCFTTTTAAVTGKWTAAKHRKRCLQDQVEKIDTMLSRETWWILQAAMAPGSPSRSLPGALRIPVLHNIRLWCHLVWMSHLTFPAWVYYQCNLEFSDETQESDKSLSDEDGTLPYQPYHAISPERSKGVFCSSAGEEIPLLSQLSVCEKDLGGRTSNLWSSPKNSKNPENSDKLLQKVRLQRFRMVKVVGLENRFLWSMWAAKWAIKSKDIQCCKFSAATKLQQMIVQSRGKALRSGRSPKVCKCFP